MVRHLWPIQMKTVSNAMVIITNMDSPGTATDTVMVMVMAMTNPNTSTGMAMEALASSVLSEEAASRATPGTGSPGAHVKGAS